VSTFSTGARVIAVTGVCKTFPAAGGDYTALRDINLEIAAGEYVAIVGRSGSGKSTLLHMLTGIDHPTSGTVVIDGTAVHTLDESAAAIWRGRTIGIVFQFFQLLPTLTVLENILLAMDFVSVIAKSERRARAEQLLELVGIARHAHKLPSALSGGEQQRAAIARALANDAPILVADEPTGNLDTHTTAAIHQLFRTLVDAGKTVIVVTHDRTTDAGYHRVVELEDGAILHDVRDRARQDADNCAREDARDDAHDDARAVTASTENNA
jgi:putative ABC transport system ATP-binding protein